VNFLPILFCVVCVSFGSVTANTKGKKEKEGLAWLAPVIQGLLIQQDTVKQLVDKPVGIQLEPVIVQCLKDVVVELGPPKVVRNLRPQLCELLGRRVCHNVVAQIPHRHKNVIGDGVLILFLLGKVLGQLLQRQGSLELGVWDAQELVQARGDSDAAVLMSPVRGHLPS